MHIPFDERPLVYVAGPYTKPDPVANTNLMINIGNALQDTGLVATVVPHVSLFLHAIDPRPYEHWLEYDLAILRRCDALYRVPGESSGADDEEKYAIRHNIPCFYSRSTLLDWARGWNERV